MSKLDARVRYTRMVIEESFLKLLQKKPVSKITVTEICELAQINRATFYKHYQDVPQLLERIEEDLFEKIKKAFENQAMSMESFLLDMLHLMQREKEQLWIIGSDNGDPNLMSKTFAICFENSWSIMKDRLAGLDEQKQKMLVRYITNGSGGILTGWVHDGMKESPEVITQYMIEMCSAVVNSVCGISK